MVLRVECSNIYTVAKGLQNGLRAAAFDEKYGDFNIEQEEQNQQENPESNRKFLIFRQLNFYKNLINDFQVV